MRASLKFITDSYRQFNRECFAGTLPEVELHVSSSRRALGCLKFRRIRDGRGWRYADFSIWISNRLDLPQEVIEDTIIHEMIHLYIHVNRLRDTSAHGKIFRTMMDAVNSRHGRRVTVSHRSSAEENASDRAVRDHYICLIRMSGGERFVTLCARSRIFDIHRQLCAAGNVASFEWRYSRNPAFNIYPRSRVLKLYRIPPELEDVLKESRLCSCDGHTLRFVSQA